MVDVMVTMLESVGLAVYVKEKELPWSGDNAEKEPSVTVICNPTKLITHPHTHTRKHTHTHKQASQNETCQ